MYPQEATLPNRPLKLQSSTMKWKQSVKCKSSTKRKSPDEQLQKQEHPTENKETIFQTHKVMQLKLPRTESQSLKNNKKIRSLDEFEGQLT